MKSLAYRRERAGHVQPIELHPTQEASRAHAPMHPTLRHFPPTLETRDEAHVPPCWMPVIPLRGHNGWALIRVQANIPIRSIYRN